MDEARDKKGRPGTTLPLCVDLDGTLVKTDLLVEALFKLLKRSPLEALKAPLWLARGKAAFKAEVFGRVTMDPTLLPYNEEYLSYLRAERQAGRSLLLATASVKPVAEAVARHLGIFDGVVATEGSINMAGRRKAEALVERFGARQFTYAANAYTDLSVWREAASAQVVSPAPGLQRLVEAVCPVEAVYESKASRFLLTLKAMRVHQWAKNLLIFAPLVFAHKVNDVGIALRALVAFVAFSLVSSSVYLVNDLLDLDSDRKHPEKRRRPFAAGDLPLMRGLFLAPGLLLCGMIAGLALSPAFFAVLAGYFVITTAYSLRLKQMVLADVLVLAVLYSWRVFAGSVATSIAPSSWFLAFLIFLFMSLALVKRVSELILTISKNLPDNDARGYVKADLPQLVSMGSASGYIAVLVLALYINDDATRALYARPDVLWLACPLFLYWVSRMWLTAHRGQMHSDPLVFALKDRTSYLLLGAMAAIWLVASGRI